MRQIWVLVLLYFVLGSVSAIDEADSFPTVDTERFPSYELVTQTQLPPLERIDIAQRFGLISDEIPPVETEPARSLGDIEIFRITSVQGGGIADIPTRLQAIGAHVYIWIEDGINPDADILSTLTSRIDTEVYEFVRDLWGEEPNPGIDGETRIHFVITQRLRSGLGGYYSANNSYPASISPNSNEYDMMVVSAQMLIPQFIDVGVSTSAHEFSHMIQHFQDVNEANWVHEGLATLTEHILGAFQPTFLLDAYVQAPETSLTMWGLGADRAAEYGAPMAFMIYLYDRFGIDAIQDVANDSRNGLQSIDNMLQARGEPSVEVIFADWVLANLLRESDTVYGYQTLSFSNEMALTADVLNTPSIFTRDLDQFGTHYYRYHNLDSSVTISLQSSETTRLIPISASSGAMIWYSQRGDNSNPRLTRSFDLTEVDSAQLTFNIWYDLEDNWDYGYVSVSTDGGQTWVLQPTELTTTSDSNGRAYGQGYTGRSGGWLTDILSLDAYAGQDILVRFEMVTDDAINLSGIALDDIQLSAINYQTDLEQDQGGWVADGWIYTDNQLPQRLWVQVVEQSATERIIHRFLADGDETWQVDVMLPQSSLYVVLSPIAPMTSEPATYTLQVE